MTLDQARQAIITRAMAFTGIEQTRIKYPNKDFTVPVDGLWCDINVLWGDSIIAAIGDTPCSKTYRHYFHQLHGSSEHT